MSSPTPPPPSPGSSSNEEDGNPANPTVWQGNSWWGGSNIDWLLASSPNDIALNPIERCAQYGFLLRLGDYAGRLVNCLKSAAVAQGLRLDDRVVRLRDKLTDESHDPSPEAQHTIRNLARSCSYLADMGLDVDSEMAKLSILVYSKRNLVCHAKVGDPKVQNDSRRLTELIKTDIASLQAILPDSQVPYAGTWERIMWFYKESQGREFPRIGGPPPPASAFREPSLQCLPVDARVKAFDSRAFADQLQAVTRTMEDRKPLTPYPVRLGRARRRPSVSDPTSYCPSRKRSASGSPSREGGANELPDNRPASSRQPSVLSFGAPADAQLLREFYGDLEALNKNPTEAREVLKRVHQTVRDELAAMRAKEEAVARKSERKRARTEARAQRKSQGP